MRKFRLIMVTVIALVILINLGSSSAIEVTPRLDADNAVYARNNLLRLHVIANSNSPADQRLKRVVRDRIIAQTEDLFKEVKDAKKAQEVVKNNLGHIKRIAKSELNKSDSDYQVKVKMGNFHFPKRTYGDLTLPAGNYDALRVVIGQGQGENWWCVLFPPFCYIDSVNKEDIKQDIDTSQLDSQLDPSQAEVRVEIKSKLGEYLEQNPKLAKKKEKMKNLLMVSITNLNNLLNNLTISE